MGNFTHVANYITKAESTPDTSDAVVLTGQLKVAAGLAHLEGKKYKQAARKFLEASPETRMTLRHIVMMCFDVVQ